MCLVMANICESRKERDQRYRDRHREEINQRRRENRLYRKSLESIASCSNVSMVQLIHDDVSMEQAEKNILRKDRDRRYRELHREHIKQRRKEKRLSKQNMQLMEIASNIRNAEKIKKNTEQLPVLPLQDDFKRLSTDRFSILQGVITDFIKSRQGLTIFSLNCRRLRKHGDDVQDSIYQNSKFLLLAETWYPDEEDVKLPNFDCIAKFKRKDVRAAGIAVYQTKKISYISTLNMDLSIRNARNINVTQTAVGDLCLSQVITDDGRVLLMVVVYISPNQNIKDIILFLHQQLLPYSHRGSRILKENFDTLPLILAGDFNVDFETRESTLLTTFLLEEFKLSVDKDPRESTNRNGTKIDAIFSRYLNKIITQPFVTYFSYHRPMPIMTCLKPEPMSTVTITEIEDAMLDVPWRFNGVL